MSDHLGTVKKWYPNAMTTTDAVHRMLNIIENNLGLEPNQLMHAYSYVVMI